ncbi:hypothetical protein A2U01_0027647, partial [Trifolium medium]|nr:hypothetical protein [Trifolium medium]
VARGEILTYFERHRTHLTNKPNCPACDESKTVIQGLRDCNVAHQVAESRSRGEL